MAAIHPSLALPPGPCEQVLQHVRCHCTHYVLNMPRLACSRHLVAVIYSVFWKTLGYNFLGQTFKVTAVTQRLQCGVWRRVLSTWTMTLSVAFSHFPNLINTHEMCCPESPLTAQREVQSLQSLWPLPFLSENTHNSHKQNGERKGFNLQKNHSALLLFGWRKERAALHFPRMSFHRGIKRFSLWHL